MLSPDRYKFIRQLIRELYDSEHYDDREGQFEAVTKAKRIFGEEIPSIAECYDEVRQYEGTAGRNARIIAAILEDYLIQNQDDCSVYSETLKALKPYNQAYRHHSNALSKYKDGIYERNTLDDMRAALESLIREITGKEKTFENQISIICTKLDEHAVKPEIRNLFHKTIDYYSKYQNNYVKHNDEVDPAEVSFVIEWTGVLMKYIINTLG